MKKQATFGLILILEALEPQEQEELAQDQGVKPSQRRICRALGERGDRRARAFLRAHETSDRAQSESHPGSESFIARVSVSWTNDFKNPYVKPCNVRNLHGRDFFTP